jgi:DNA-binding transcriptional LysR family regulator
VGARLFDRNGGKVALTGAGKLAEFKKLYPNVGVQISRLERAKIMESIIDNSVDFGVVSAPVDDKRLTVVNIHRDELGHYRSARTPAQPRGGRLHSARPGPRLPQRQSPQPRSPGVYRNRCQDQTASFAAGAPQTAR